MRENMEWLMKEYQARFFVIAFNICQNAEDAKDIVQDTFISYYTTQKRFNDEEHRKAWLFRVAINKAKNVTKTYWRKNKMPLEDYVETLAFEADEDSTLFDAVMGLPEKFRLVIHLYYYEDLSVKEIAKVLKISESNVKVRLSRGRKILKAVLKEEWDDDE